MTRVTPRLFIFFALTLMMPAPALAIPPAQALTPEGRWYAVQLHCHSRYSDGLHPIGDLVRWAKEGGLDAIAITDHNTNIHLKDSVYQQPQGVTLIPAYEWTEGEGPCATHVPWDDPERCHVNVWGLKPDTPILPGTLHRNQMMAASAGLGVTLGANHPVEPRYPWPDEDFSGVSTIEVWQWQYGLDEAPGTPLPPDAHSQHKVPWQFFYRNSRAIAMWQRALLRGQHLTPVAVADFHIGSPLQSVVSPCTLIWSRTNEVSDLLANLRAGHVCLVEEPHGPKVELWADRDGDGSYQAMAGDEVPVGAKLQVRVTGGEGQALTVFNAAGAVETHDVRTDPYVEDLSAAKAGFYWARLDRHRAFNPILSMSGAIFVR